MINTKTKIKVEDLSIHDLVLITKKDSRYTSWSSNYFGVVATITGEIITIINASGRTETVDLNYGNESEYYEIYHLSEYAYIEEIENKIREFEARARDARDECTKLELYLETFKSEISLFGKLKKLFTK